MNAIEHRSHRALRSFARVSKLLGWVDGRVVVIAATTEVVDRDLLSMEHEKDAQETSLRILVMPCHE